MKRMILMGIAATMVLGSAPAAEVVDGVVAIVNKRVITHSDVRDAVRPLIERLPSETTREELTAKVRAAQRDALNQLIERSLILDEFQARKAVLPDTIVSNLVNEYISGQFGGDRAAFIKTLQAERMTLSQFRERERERFIVRAMLHQKTEGDMVVSPYKIEKYYREHTNQFDVAEQVMLRMIVVRKKPAAASADGGRTVAEEILGKLQAGARFDTLAKEFSEDTTASRGGNWGWIGRTDLGKELSDVAFSLAAGQHSGIVETDQGYYLLQVDETKSAHIKPLGEVRDEIEKTLLQELRTQKQKQWVESLRAKAYVRLF